MVKSRIFAALIGLYIILPAAAFGQGRESRVVFTSTKWEEEVSPEFQARTMRDVAPPTFKMKGCDTIADVSETFAKMVSESMGEIGLNLLPRREVTALRAHNTKFITCDKNALVFRPKNEAALKDLVGKLTWIGSRETGKVSGEVNSLYIVVTPGGIEFDEGVATFHVSGRILGDCLYYSKHQLRAVSGLDPTTYNMDDLFGEVVAALRKPLTGDSLAKIDQIGTRVVAEYKAMASEWASLAAQKGYGNKIPASWQSNTGIDGSWEKNMGILFARINDSVKQGVTLDVQGYEIRLDNLQDSLAKQLKIFKEAKREVRWPDGFDHDATWDAIQIITAHQPVIIGQLQDAKTLLKGLI